MSEATNTYMREYQPEYIARLRDRAFDEVGSSACEECGFDDKRALDFDHIDNDGAEHRREVRSQYGRLRHVIDHPMLYQVLCKNCNWIKYLKSKGERSEREPRSLGRPVLVIREVCDTCGRKIDHTGRDKCSDCKNERQRCSQNRVLHKDSYATVP